MTNEQWFTVHTLGEVQTCTGLTFNSLMYRVVGPPNKPEIIPKELLIVPCVSQHITDSKSIGERTWIDRQENSEGF